MKGDNGTAGTNTVLNGHIIVTIAYPLRVPIYCGHYQPNNPVYQSFTSIQLVQWAGKAWRLSNLPDMGAVVLGTELQIPDIHPPLHTMYTMYTIAYRHP